jgi:hypothetical protein
MEGASPHATRVLPHTRIEANPHAVMTAALPLLRGATSRTLWKKEYDHGPTDRGPSGHRFRIV